MGLEQTAALFAIAGLLGGVSFLAGFGSRWCKMLPFAWAGVLLIGYGTLLALLWWWAARCWDCSIFGEDGRTRQRLLIDAIIAGPFVGLLLAGAAALGDMASSAFKRHADSGMRNGT